MSTAAKEALLERQRIKVYKWANMTTTANIGQAVEVPVWADKTVQVAGAFGANGSVTLEGSLQYPTAGNYSGMNDPQGSLIAIANANELVAVQEHAYWVRPKVTAGDANTVLNVYLQVVD